MTPENIKTLLEALTATLTYLDSRQDYADVAIDPENIPRDPSSAALDAIVSICDHVTDAFRAAKSQTP